MNCQIEGEPKPLLEWILPDGSKVRAPYSSYDRRIIISAEGKLTLRGADASDTGVYRCIATNYLDADILVFRVTVLSPDVEEAEVNGVQLSRPLGENLVFDCSSSGSPPASAQWILPDHSVLDKSHGNRKVYENGTLLIQGLTARDRGFYRCLVANHLGIDLLVSQLTVTEEKSETVTVLDSEGSGTETEDKIDPSLSENSQTVTFNENPSSSPSDRTMQESRTVTSDRPYPRLRSPGRGGSGGRLLQRRRPVSSRRTWSSRVFDKASRKVDPQKFAEFMKKAQDGSRIKANTEKERARNADSNPGLSGDGEIGSGEDHNEDHLIIVPRIVKPATGNTRKTRIFGQENRQPETIKATETGQHSKVATNQIVAMETVSNHIDSSQVTESKNTPTIESYTQSDSAPIKFTFTNNPTERSDRQSDAVTPYNSISHNTVLPSFDETSEFSALERSTKQGSNRRPVTLQLTVTDSSQETQLQFSGEQPAQPETSTWAALSFTTDPNVTPMRDGPGPVELVVHTSTDPESQTTYTAVTTTERQQDEITFHTTQTIKSPRLPAGSTIISRQKIHIIPHKNSRGGGRRRTFQGRRRIIKPGRITDIQSFINKLKQPSVKKEGNATVPYRIELTTGKQRCFVRKHSHC